jgi:hypothetical protein
MTGWRQPRKGLARCPAASTLNCSSATQPCGDFTRTLAACRPDQRHAAGDVPDVRPRETRDPQQSGGDEGTFDCRRAGLAYLPRERSTRTRPRLPGEMTTYRLVRFQRQRLALEAEPAANRCVIDSSAQSVAGGAPERAYQRAPLVENADRGCEQWEAIDEVRGAINQIDRPQEVVRAALVLELLADDPVLWKALGEASADQNFDRMVDLGHGVAKGLCSFRQLLLSDGERPAERALDFRSGKPRQLERRFLEFQEHHVRCSCRFVSGRCLLVHIMPPDPCRRRR